MHTKSYKERARKRLMFYPRSMVQLITTGLSIVVLPLLFALGIAAIFVERATSESQQAVILSTKALSQSLALSDILKEMERAARIYQVLTEKQLLENYQQLREKLTDTATELLSIELDDELRQKIQLVLKQEQQLFAVISSSPPGSETSTNAIEQFAEMREVTRSVTASNSHAIERKVTAMKEAAIGARQALMLEAVAAVALATLFGYMIIPPLIRYMSELDRSIQELGTGNLKRKIELAGPRDVRELGERLEWLRQNLETLENRKQRFLQHFSHELKTPLASIREGSSLLADGVTGELNSEQVEIACILRNNSLRLQRQVEDLLTFSVSMQPFQSLNHQSIKLHSQIQAAINEHQLQSRAKNLQFETHLSPVTLSADPTLVATILDNLISNAVKYSPENGRITVHLFVNEGYAVTDICDHGPGIPPGEREKIFEVFYKIQDQPHDDIEGSGLGLSIAKQFAKAHGGNIEVVDSTEGACLRFSLPLHTYLL